MDLTVINGLGPARREKLGSAGIKTIDALARSDPDKLSETVGIASSLLADMRDQALALRELTAIDGVGDDEALALFEAGIRSKAELAGADAGTLAEATGATPAEVRAWQGRGAGKIETAGVATRLATTRALEGIENARVVLQEGIEDARIKFEQDVLAEARILPVKARDNVERMLEEIKGNVVVLRERADTALVRVENEVYEGLPLFKEKVEQAGHVVADEVEEVRVRVQEIRDKRVMPQANKLTSKFMNLFGGGSKE